MLAPFDGYLAIESVHYQQFRDWPRRNFLKSCVESLMSVETDERLVECLNMASEAARKAEVAASPGEANFWLRMERRWHSIAKTYSETEQLAATWRAVPQVYLRVTR
jgi:hypothetical protein